jgi:integrase
VVGSIRRVTHASGEQAWQARWRDPTGRQRSRNFTRRLDAERHLTTVEAQMLAGDYIDPGLAKTRFADWLPHAEAARLDRRPSTKTRDESVLRSLVLPTFGDIPIGSIQPLTMQQWLAELSDRGYAPATIRKAYQLLSRTLTAAVDAGLLHRSPCRGIRLPRIERAEMRFLTPDEIRRLAETIHPRYRTLVLTAAYTGARYGELAALDLDHYHPARRIIHIEHTLTEVRGHLHLGQPKTRAARRTLTLPHWLIDTVDTHLADWSPSDDGLIFTAPDGGPLRRSGFRSRHWKPAVKASIGEPMRFHDLRHSHVALLIDQGTHPAVIAARLGHTSVTTVLDVYGHLYDGLDRSAADTLAPPWDAPDVDAMWSRRRTRGLGLER